MSRTLQESVARIRGFRERDAYLAKRFPGSDQKAHNPLTTDQMLDKGYSHARVTSYGYAMGVMPTVMGGGMVCCGVDWDGGHDVVYMYAFFDDAVRAFATIDESLLSEPVCREPEGWVRRRPKGDKSMEYRDGD